MTKKPVTTKKIGVLMGGFSSEREISMRTGLAVYQSLQELGYACVPVDVNRDIAAVLKKDKIKLAFLALHGGIGENGAIQGMLEVLGIPYTGSGVLASALAMDKEASKKIFMYHGLPVAEFMAVGIPKGKKGKSAAEPPKIGFPLPWVVKPASEGSSIGVTIVKEEAQLMPAVQKAFALGDRVLIERFISGKEIHIGVLGDRALGGVEVRPSLEFYNYEAKYTSGLTEYIIPPQIDDAIYSDLKNKALQAHNALGCSGASRVDFIVDAEGTPHILEVNTLPGMTSTSLLPKIAQSAGISFKELIEEIIAIAAK
ncbi:MAG: D-alanine--D-alanine ligase [Thermodesulfovibrionia bacterium]|nr:D-alanine--D-alanine ligase [Thermodesulfovibrionia bacterium]